jgi:hypothetical protein
MFVGPVGITTGITSVQVADNENNGGERGIRTPDTRKGIHAFEARAFSHSAISPRPLVHFILSGKLWASDSHANLIELSPDLSVV